MTVTLNLTNEQADHLRELVNLDVRRSANALEEAEMTLSDALDEHRDSGMEEDISDAQKRLGVAQRFAQEITSAMETAPQQADDLAGVRARQEASRGSAASGSTAPRNVPAAHRPAEARARRATGLDR